MNIFAFDDDVRLSAQWLDDVRKNKMISETNQLLASAINTLTPDNDVEGLCGYPKSVPAHGCARWARAASENFLWLLKYNREMLSQWGDVHKGYDRLVAAEKWFHGGGRDSFPEQMRTPFYNGTTNQELGISYKHIANTNAAYRMYIRHRWQLDTIKLSWKRGKEPWWK
jgi:hypothetical protein